MSKYRKRTNSECSECSSKDNQESNESDHNSIIAHASVIDYGKNIKLDKTFFNIPCYNLAAFLLGKVLVRKLANGNILKGRIVETECYLGGEDKASQSYNGKRTPRNEAMFMEAGTVYVYMTYGMYYCMNISSTESGAAVLLRALDPLEGLDKITELRLASRKSSKQLKKFKDDIISHKDLCNGPSKLCMAFDISKNNFNKVNVCNSDSLWIEEDENYQEEIQIVKTSRIGIDSVGPEWAKKPLRFYILGNKSVSKRDKKAENNLIQKS